MSRLVLATFAAAVGVLALAAEACTHDFDTFSGTEAALDGSTGDGGASSSSSSSSSSGASGAIDGGSTSSSSGAADGGCGATCVDTARACAQKCQADRNTCYQGCGNSNGCKSKCRDTDSQCRQACRDACVPCMTNAGCSSTNVCQAVTQ